jgi:hypothetical protein
MGNEMRRPETGFKRSIDESQDHERSSADEVAGDGLIEPRNKRVHLVQEQLSMLAIGRSDDASIGVSYVHRDTVSHGMSMSQSFAHFAPPNAYGYYYETNRILNTLHMEALMRRSLQ